MATATLTRSVQKSGLRSLGELVGQGSEQLIPLAVLHALALGAARLLPDSGVVPLALRREAVIGGHAAAHSIEERDGRQGILLSITLDVYRPTAKSVAVWIDSDQVVAGVGDPRDLEGVPV